MDILQQLVQIHPDKFICTSIIRSAIYHVDCLKLFAYSMDDGSVYIQDVDDDNGDLHLNEYEGRRQLTFSGNGIIRHVDDYGELEKIALEYDMKVNRILKRLVKEERFQAIRKL